LQITTLHGKSFFVSDKENLQILKIKEIVTFSKVVEERVLFSFDDKNEVAIIKGVDSIYSIVNDVKKSIFNGKWLEANSNEVVVGYGIADKLSMGLFDYNNSLQVFVPKPGAGIIETEEDAFTKESLVPTGIFAVNDDIDSKYIFADMGLVQELLQYKTNQISSIEIKLKPNTNEEKLKNELQKVFKTNIVIKNRAQLNDSLYKMLNAENAAVYLIFTLVIILTLFTLAGAIIMMIIDKKSNLKTLLNLGVGVNDLRKIFLMQGILLTFIGGVLGVILGIIFVLIQQQFNVIMITPTLAYPVVFSFQNIIIVLITIFTLGFLASLIASSRVTKSLLN
jgi:lipoprotein-releasing system permease protein